jgi:endoglucanase
VEPYVFMGSMGNNTEDFDMYAPVELYEKYAPKRIMGYCTKDIPCSEITGDAAAALAAASELLKGDNPAWAAKALEHARQLYAFATEFPKSYMEVNDNGALEIHRYFYTRWGAARAGCAAAGPRTLACVCAQEF